MMLDMTCDDCINPLVRFGVINTMYVLAFEDVIATLVRN
jgi:hypothetical protein